MQPQVVVYPRPAPPPVYVPSPVVVRPVPVVVNVKMPWAGFAFLMMTIVPWSRVSVLFVESYEKCASSVSCAPEAKGTRVVVG